MSQWIQGAQIGYMAQEIFKKLTQPGIQAYKPVGQQIGCFPHPKYGVMTMWVRPELINVSHRFSRIPPLFRMRYKSFKFLAI